MTDEPVRQPDTVVEAAAVSTRQCADCEAGRRCERLEALKRDAWEGAK